MAARWARWRERRCGRCRRGWQGSPGGAGGGPARRKIPVPIVVLPQSSWRRQLRSSLPDPFAMHGGTRITTKAQWRCRRERNPEKTSNASEIGTKPAPPTVGGAAAFWQHAQREGDDERGEHHHHVDRGHGIGHYPHCVAIGMNGNSRLISGGACRFAFMRNQVVRTSPKQHSDVQSDHFYKVYPRRGARSETTLRGRGASAASSMASTKGENAAQHRHDQDRRPRLFLRREDGPLRRCLRRARRAHRRAGIGRRRHHLWRTSQQFTTRTGINVSKSTTRTSTGSCRGMRTLVPSACPRSSRLIASDRSAVPSLPLRGPGYDWLARRIRLQSRSLPRRKSGRRQEWKPTSAATALHRQTTPCAAPTSEVNSTTRLRQQVPEGQTATTTIAIQPNEATSAEHH